MTFMSSSLEGCLSQAQVPDRLMEWLHNIFETTKCASHGVPLHYLCLLLIEAGQGAMNRLGNASHGLPIVIAT